MGVYTSQRSSASTTTNSDPPSIGYLNLKTETAAVVESDRVRLRRARAREECAGGDASAHQPQPQDSMEMSARGFERPPSITRIGRWAEPKSAAQLSAEECAWRPHAPPRRPSRHHEPDGLLRTRPRLVRDEFAWFCARVVIAAALLRSKRVLCPPADKRSAPRLLDNATPRARSSLRSEAPRGKSDNREYPKALQIFDKSPCKSLNFVHCANRLGLTLGRRRINPKLKYHAPVAIEARAASIAPPAEMPSAGWHSETRTIGDNRAQFSGSIRHASGRHRTFTARSSSSAQIFVPGSLYQEAFSSWVVPGD
ncbi:hypothetical protein DFH09DRAFT_1448404 [Mycena vulgaris]|nr:hypothetical protein DFH09DRAFT_1448404 [Mycena vulgaris]